MSTIWDVAKGIELEGKELYESLAASAPKAQLAGAFAALAREEQRHYEIFASFEKSVADEVFAAEPVLSDVPTLMRNVTAELMSLDNALGALRDAEFAYRKALVLERASIDEYTRIRSGLTDNLQKGILGLILKEEARHVAIIEGFIEFVHRPKEWVEDAEFNHAEEY